MGCMHPAARGVHCVGCMHPQVRLQKENQLAVLTGEVTYLQEHQSTVQRKSSELTSRMADIEASITAAAYKEQRVLHSNELATADRRRAPGPHTQCTTPTPCTFPRGTAEPVRRVRHRAPHPFPWPHLPHRRELLALGEETKELESKFGRLREDVRVLYKDKLALREQLASAKAETADVEKCVTQYRKSVSNIFAEAL